MAGLDGRYMTLSSGAYLILRALYGMSPSACTGVLLIGGSVVIRDYD
jgi:hypothetical protein